MTLATPHLSGLAEHLLDRYRSVRARSLALAAPLSAEDQCVQSMPDASPTKWHLGHTTWFFETIVLQAHVPGYQAFDLRLGYLFNSYYEALGPRHPRPQRGLLTRPPLDQVHAYRRYVDAAIALFLQSECSAHQADALALLELGLNHEEQHQELLLTDILHLLSCNPLLPAYGASPEAVPPQEASPVQWLPVGGGISPLGVDDDPAAFCFDNETPRHARLVAPFQIAHRPVSCADYLEFVQDGGYSNPLLWLSDGWAQVRSQGWAAPLYWLAPEDPRCPAPNWQVFSLDGVQALKLADAVSQISFYEAMAYAEWAGARLPTEFEWELAMSAPGIDNMLGSVWQWTRSAYEPYPGFKPRNGAVREYNGKFMVGQQVLRGSSVATPPGHSRGTYRNFFPPAARWQFSGLRLARDA
jgi:ergothioneine biosynthesis protein EgtB